MNKQRTREWWKVDVEDIHFILLNWAKLFIIIFYLLCFDGRFPHKIPLIVLQLCHLINENAMATTHKQIACWGELRYCSMLAWLECLDIEGIIDSVFNRNLALIWKDWISSLSSSSRAHGFGMRNGQEWVIEGLWITNQPLWPPIGNHWRSKETEWRCGIGLYKEWLRIIWTERNTKHETDRNQKMKIKLCVRDDFSLWNVVFDIARGIILAGQLIVDK